MKTSSLYLADAIPVDSIGAPVPGFVVVGLHPSGRVYLHAEPGRDPLLGMTVVKTGNWRWSDLDASEHGDQILESIIDTGNKDPSGRPILRRVKRSERKLQGKSPIVTGLPPHQWFGEQL